MRRSFNYLIPLAAAPLLWGGSAGAQGDAGTPNVVANNPSASTVVIPECVRDQVKPGMSAEDLALLSQTECIPVYDERPDKPFDRDTEIRLTGEQLAARGAVDLATALALLPDVAVRDAGRGGYNIDIRGGRKGEVSILIDGVLVTDPYYGTFDLTSVPITDIVQIRVATTPQSPIDGPGGPGGYIEVHTRDAFGPQLVIARLEGDTLPSTAVTAMMRTPITNNLALRVSGGGTVGGHDYSLLSNAMSVNEDRHDANGAARLEYRKDDLRVVADGFVDDRHYIAPPNDNQEFFLDIDRESTQRADVKVDDKIDGYQVQGEVGMQHLHRLSRTFTDPTMQTESLFEDLNAWRESAFALITHPIGKELRWAASTTVLHESADVGTLASTPTTGDMTEIEPAVDLQYEHATVRLDGAGGISVPIGLGASPYGEFKLVAKWRPNYGNLEITATAGRKGRVPSLRERFEPGDGDPKLGPEFADHGEIRAIEHINDHVHVEVAPFYRYTQGVIRTAPITDMSNPLYGKLINLGEVDFYGVDTLGRITINRYVEVGGGYSYIHAHGQSDPNNPKSSTDHPLDRLPASRADAWVQVTPYPRFSAIMRAIYFGANYGNEMGAEELLPGYTTYQATATWQINEKYLAVLKGDDITDVRPETRPHVFGVGTTITLVLQGSWD
jgi:outer membrane cobalamin receptor|nr:TonB-dependent receptor [Kofleriaceae bacterium]